MKRYDNDPDAIAKGLRGLERATDWFIASLGVAMILVLIGLIMGVVYLAQHGVN